MSDRAALQAELLLLCGKVRDHTLTPGDAARLDELLQADDSASLLFVRYLSIVSLLESRGLGQRITKEEAEHAEEVDHGMFEELLALEDRAEAEVVEQTSAQRRAKAKKAKRQSGRVKRSVLGQPVVWVGVLMACAIVATLFFVMRSGESPELAPDRSGDKPKPITQRPDKPATPTVSEPIIVATLTAAHQAVWEGGDLRPGADLLAGQHFSLVSGFAEVSTQHNAVLLIEGPAQFELHDNGSTLFLEAGRLVCNSPSESDRQIVVRTLFAKASGPGSEFGVSAESRSMEATVFAGKALVETPEGLSRALDTGETVRVFLDIDRAVISLREQPINEYARELTGK